MFGLPGGEILDFIEAARAEGIEFLLTRHEATAAFMADVTGQIQRSARRVRRHARSGRGEHDARRGQRVSRSLAGHRHHGDAGAREPRPIATHQDLDLNAVYRPFTKLAITLDGEDTAAQSAPGARGVDGAAHGPGAHRAAERHRARGRSCRGDATPRSDHCRASLRHGDARCARGGAARHLGARRPIVILGLDLDPHADTRGRARVRRARWTCPCSSRRRPRACCPKIIRSSSASAPASPATRVVLDLFDARRSAHRRRVRARRVRQALASHDEAGLDRPGARSRAATSGRARKWSAIVAPPCCRRSSAAVVGPFDVDAGDRARFRADLEAVLRPAATADGLSGYELTRRLRELFPRDTIFTTDVGSVKSVTSQAWTTLRAADVLRVERALGDELQSARRRWPRACSFPIAPVLCTIGDGGFGMTLAEIETCVRERLHFVTVVLQRQQPEPDRRGARESRVPDRRRALRPCGLRRRCGRLGRLVAPRGDDGRARSRRP